LVVFMAAFLFVIGYLVGEVAAPGAGLGGLFVAFVVWLVLTLVAYFAGDQIFLAVSGARRIQHDDHPVLFDVVEEMKIAAALPKLPDIYIIDDDAPNAFATGRSPETASVAVTAGLLEILDRDELQGVIAHELSHIKNRDILYMTMVGVMMGTIVLLADVGLRVFFSGATRRTSSRSRGGGQAQLVILLVAIVLMILAPIIAQLIYLAVSRRREYLADACGALYTRYPEGLARALEKLARSTQPLRSATRATAPLYIVNPLAVTPRGLSDLTSTHPPISERIRILRSMAGGSGFRNYDEAFRKVTGRPVGVIPFSAINEAPEVAQQVPAKTDTRSQTERVRQTKDALWRLGNYIFLPCTCGATLKVPPAYAGKKIACPRCGTVHTVTAKGLPV